MDVTGKYGTAFDMLTMPATVKVTAQGSGAEKEFEVPVVWSGEGCDATAETQTVAGTLDYSTIPELEGDTSISATIHLAMNEVSAPEISDFTKTYDGAASALPVPELPEGIADCSVSYTGTSFAGDIYGPSADAPVNAGTYTAAVSFVMTPGYAQLGDAAVSYTVDKAAQAVPESLSTIIIAYDSIVMRQIESAEYSLDGISWQNSNSFYGLSPNTQYTVYARIPETADGNYAASEAVSMIVVTSHRQAQVPALESRTVTYTGTAQEYKVTSITGVRNINVIYSLNGEVFASAPIDAGEYDVSLSFEMESGYKQLENMTSKLIILKAPQSAPTAAVTATTDTSLIVAKISGAEYSIDGGSTWQTSNVFTDLNRNTRYTVLVRMAEDKNHASSPTVEASGSTSMTAAQIPSSMPSYTVTYDGTAKEYLHAAQLLEIDGVQSAEVTYSGTTNAGVSYRSTTPPAEAGQYAVTILLRPESGYTLSTSLLGSKMTIERAPQVMPEAPSIARVTTATVTVNPIAGAEYNGNNGAARQTSNSFTGLAPETSFTVLVRLAETPNYQASEVYSLPARTLANK